MRFVLHAGVILALLAACAASYSGDVRGACYMMLNACFIQLLLIEDQVARK